MIQMPAPDPTILAVAPELIARLERAIPGGVIADSTVQEKAIAFPTDSRLLEIARHEVATAAKSASIVQKQTFAREGKTHRRRGGGCAHARQYKRLRRVLERQRTVPGIVLRGAQHKIATATTESWRNAASVVDDEGACRAHSHVATEGQGQALRDARSGS